MRPIDVHRSTTYEPVDPVLPEEPETGYPNLLVGIISRKGFSVSGGHVSGVLAGNGADARVEGVLQGAVLNPSWSHERNAQGVVIQQGYQEVEGSPIVTPSWLENALDAADADGFGVRLRGRYGRVAPAWAKALGSGPIEELEDPQGIGGNPYFSAGAMWDPLYRTAADAVLEHEVTNLLPAHPCIREVSDARFSTYYEEFMIWQMANALNRQKYLAAGYNLAKHDDTYAHAIASAADLFTGSVGWDIVLNTFQGANPDGTFLKSLSRTYDLIDQAVAEAQNNGAKPILMNHSIRSTMTSGDYWKQFVKMRDSGLPVAYQTVATGNSWWNNEGASETLYDVLSFAVDLGACSVEPPGTPRQFLEAGGRKSITFAQAENLIGRMQANAAPFLAA